MYGSSAPVLLRGSSRRGGRHFHLLPATLRAVVIAVHAGDRPAVRLHAETDECLDRFTNLLAYDFICVSASCEAHSFIRRRLQPHTQPLHFSITSCNHPPIQPANAPQ